MTPVEAAWVAGIIEGEGCIIWTKQSNARIQVRMSDQDTVERLAEWAGVGLVREGPRLPNRKPLWVWSVDRADDLFALFDAIEPYLLSRRAAKLRDVRALLERHRDEVAQRRDARSKTCKRGHSISPGHPCKPCHAAYMREYRKQWRAAS